MYLVRAPGVQGPGVRVGFYDSYLEASPYDIDSKHKLFIYAFRESLAAVRVARTLRVLFAVSAAEQDMCWTQINDHA